MILLVVYRVLDIHMIHKPSAGHPITRRRESTRIIVRSLLTVAQASVTRTLPVTLETFRARSTASMAMLKAAIMASRCWDLSLMAGTSEETVVKGV